jgi:hypothetical protein
MLTPIYYSGKTECNPQATVQRKQNNSYRKIKQNATVHQNLLFRIYMKLNMFRATHRPSSGA